MGKCSGYRIRSNTHLWILATIKPALLLYFTGWHLQGFCSFFVLRKSYIMYWSYVISCLYISLYFFAFAFALISMANMFYRVEEMPEDSSYKKLVRSWEPRNPQEIFRTWKRKSRMILTLLPHFEINSLFFCFCFSVCVFTRRLVVLTEPPLYVLANVSTFP